MTDTVKDAENVFHLRLTFSSLWTILGCVVSLAGLCMWGGFDFSANVTSRLDAIIVTNQELQKELSEEKNTLDEHHNEAVRRSNGIEANVNCLRREFYAFAYDRVKPLSQKDCSQ